MAVPGHSTTVKISGTAVATTAEATTSLGGQAYQVTNTAKRIIDPSVVVVVKDAGSPIASAGVLIDYLFGKFTLLVAPGGAVTADFTYLPVAAIAEVTKVSLKRSRNLLDRTSFDSGGTRQRLAGLLDAEGTLMGLNSLLADVDPVAAGVQSLQAFFDAGTPKLLEIRPGGSGNYYRVWVLLEELGEDVSFDGLVERSIGFKGTALQGLGEAEGAAAGWGS